MFSPPGKIACVVEHRRGDGLDRCGLEEVPVETAENPMETGNFDTWRRCGKSAHFRRGGGAAARHACSRGAQPRTIGGQRSRRGAGSAAWNKVVSSGRARHRTDRGRRVVPCRSPGRVGARCSGRVGSVRPGRLQARTLAVHASQTIASYWLPRHLVAFRRAYPGIDIRLAIGNTAQVAAAVHQGTADMAFIEGKIEDPALTVEQVARDQMVIVVGPEHPWSAVVDRLAQERLVEAEWVLREPGSGTRSVFEAALQTFGVSLAAVRIVLELPSNEAVRAAVEAGLGATAISASVASSGLEAGLLHHVPFDLPEREFHVVRHPERHHSRAVGALLKMVTNSLGDRVKHSFAGMPLRRTACDRACGGANG